MNMVLAVKEWPAFFVNIMKQSWPLKNFLLEHAHVFQKIFVLVDTSYDVSCVHDDSRFVIFRQFKPMISNFFIVEQFFVENLFYLIVIQPFLKLLHFFHLLIYYREECWEGWGCCWTLWRISIFLFDFEVWLGWRLTHVELRLVGRWHFWWCDDHWTFAHFYFWWF